MKGGLAILGGAIAVVTWAVMYNGLQWLVGPPAFPFQIGLAASLIPGAEGGQAPVTPSRGATVAKTVAAQAARPKNQSPHVGRQKPKRKAA